MKKLKRKVEFTDRELELMFNLVLGRIKNGGMPIIMREYLHLYEKLGRMIEENEINE